VCHILPSLWWHRPGMRCGIPTISKHQADANTTLEAKR